MNDSRYQRGLASLEMVATAADAAETDGLRELAGEIGESDPRAFQLRLLARFFDLIKSGADEHLSAFAEADSA